MIESKSLAAINQEAISILSKELGVVDTLRFLNQYSMGAGNYTKERRELLKDVTLDNILKDIQAHRAE